PFIASAPEGGWLAVVGDPENEILVHSVADLLQGRPGPQRLRGVGEPVRTATFVRKGAVDWGLQLGRAPQAGPDDLVFDLTNRRFSPSAVGWTVSQPAAGGWEAKLVPTAPLGGQPNQPTRSPRSLGVYQAGNMVGRGIPVRPARTGGNPDAVQVTAHGLLPPGPAAVPI